MVDTVNKYLKYCMNCLSLSMNIALMQISINNSMPSVFFCGEFQYFYINLTTHIIPHLSSVLEEMGRRWPPGHMAQDTDIKMPSCSDSSGGTYRHFVPAQRSLQAVCTDHTPVCSTSCYPKSYIIIYIM